MLRGNFLSDALKAINSLSLMSGRFYSVSILKHTICLYLRLPLPAARLPTFLKDHLRYPLGREGVYAPGRHALLAHAMQRVGYIVGLTAYG